MHGHHSSGLLETALIILVQAFWHIPAGSQRERRRGIDRLDPWRANGSFPGPLSQKPLFRVQPDPGVVLHPIEFRLG